MARIIEQYLIKLKKRTQLTFFKSVLYGKNDFIDCQVLLYCRVKIPGRKIKRPGLKLIETFYLYPGFW
jgi:hypothetical protein